MSLKSSFLILAAFMIMVLVGGSAVIYFDGSKKIATDWERSGLELEKNLVLVDYISLAKSISLSSNRESKNLDELIVKIKKKEALLKNHLQINNLSFEILNKSYNKIIALQNDIKSNQQKLKKIKKKASSSWEQIENELSSTIVEKMKGEKEFLPGVKSALTTWGEDISFFEKIKNTIDVSVIDNNEYSETKKLVNFSRWLIDKKNNNTLLDKKVYDEALKKILNLESHKGIRDNLKANLQKYYEHNLKVITLEQSLASKKTSLNNEQIKVIDFINKELVPSWQKVNMNDHYQELLKSNEKHSDVLLSMSFVILLVMILMGMLFFSIFPKLELLEKKAKRVAEGDYSIGHDSYPRNELGTVLKSFDSMSEKIAHSLKKQKEMESEKVRLISEINNSRKLTELGEFSAKMAHELKNPISILSFCLSDAKEGVENGDDNKALDELGKSLQTLERLKIIASKLGAKSSISVASSVNVKSLCNEFCDMYESLLSKEGITLSNKFYDEEIDESIHVSKIEVMSALSNLMDNAIEFLKNNREYKQEIIFEVTRKDNMIIFKVENNGPILEDGNKLFQKFYSEKSGELRGLGLVIARDIVREFDGDILYVHKDEQNIFQINIPLSQA